MTQSPIARANRTAALALALLGSALTVSACASDPYGNRSFANQTNPHPELMVTVVKPSDVRVLANATDPLADTHSALTTVGLK